LVLTGETEIAEKYRTANNIFSIKMLGVPSGKEANFYKESAALYGAGQSDAFFRNMNSIIIISALSKPSKFVFMGDTTVHNMYYNMKNRKTHLDGSGNDILTLPHHGSYTTSVGKETLFSAEIVFLQFLRTIAQKKY
jgi:beta-lactamase superfamily II metal-dependent hydrolase